MAGVNPPRTGIGIHEDHVALADTVARWAESRCSSAVARHHLEAEEDLAPEFWTDLASQGWLGLHVPEADGGSGYGLVELSVVLEQLGRRCAPGPMLPTVIVSAALDRFGSGPVRDLLPRLVDGSAVAGVAVGCEPADLASNGRILEVNGEWETMGAALADHLLLPVRSDGVDERWLLVDRDQVAVDAHLGLDRTRRPGRVTARELTVPQDRILRCAPGPGGIAGLASLLIAAESVGLASWCVDTAAAHAATRVQFGRPIGQFQAIKHRCADMLCALEASRAAAWQGALSADRADPSTPLAIAAAATLGPDTAYTCAKDCVQVLGGIGFTWEHDAHLYLKRAMANRLVTGPAHWNAKIAALADDGMRPSAVIELPAEAEAFRVYVRAFLDDLAMRPKEQWNRRIGTSGFLVPHWPAPWGRDASPLEQLVIDEEFRAARVRRPHLAVGAWALPTIIAHGTEEQQERFVPPTLRMELSWCQMFSEPDAGSDLAALSTRADRTTGGWLLSGQKVWTSLALSADWGICLARTDPSRPKHEGIGCFLVDMSSEGIDVRPLRELTGAEMFNEVFLDEVFVPDDCVVGDPTAGWHAARTTLGNERVSMGSGSSMGPGLESLVALVSERDGFADTLIAQEVGGLVATAQALSALGTRLTLRALAGAAPGPEASVRKLLGVEHDQRVQEVGVEVVGIAGLAGDGAGSHWVGGFLANRSLSIAGGTSEIQRNVIGERLLGLPRDGHDVR